MSFFKKIKNFITGQNNDAEGTVQDTVDEVAKTTKHKIPMTKIMEEILVTM